MPKKRSTNIRLAADDIQKMVRVVRGQRVMLDSDLARLYGVTTAALNQAVQRNTERFPEDFAYQLTQQEVTNLISQIVISKLICLCGTALIIIVVPCHSERSEESSRQLRSFAALRMTVPSSSYYTVSRRYFPAAVKRRLLLFIVSIFNPLALAPNL
jgi:hypothetical protein